MRRRGLHPLFYLAGADVRCLPGGAWVVWHYTERLRREAFAPRGRPAFDLVVKRIDEGEVELAATEITLPDGDWLQPGVWGLEAARAYGRVGGVIERRTASVVRSFESVSGSLRPGDRARLDSFVFPLDPRTAHRIEFEEVAVQAPIGPLPAWYVPGPSPTWAVFVHGKDSWRGECLRLLPLVHGLGLPALALTYRNDAGNPPDPSGYHRYGLTEWRDLEAAVAHALARGARDLVLVGFSMGGAIALSFLYESDLRGRVAGLVLDSAMIDFGRALDYGAARSGVPPVVVAALRGVAQRRFDIDFRRLDYTARAHELAAPVLLLHAADDAMLPVEAADALARLRPDIVTYQRFTTAGHGRLWNVHRERYEAALREFLLRVAASPVPAAKRRAASRRQSRQSSG